MLKHFRRQLVLIILSAVVNISFIHAADWPQYKNDAARSGYTAEALPSNLKQAWVLKCRQAPIPAWPNVGNQRMLFDFAYQPVIAGNTLYYGSSADCQLHAIDVKTGKEKWTFFTNAPIRFAPIVHQGLVFVASDDGCLYAVNTVDGKLAWKLRASPSNEKIIGNERLISMWPARSGLLLQDNVLYFGAGIFPTQGFFLYALEPKTGKPIWINDKEGNTHLYQYNHGFGYSNVIGQGYLAASKDTLLVSTGRAIPAAFKLNNGEFIYYNPLEVYRSGGDRVMIADDLFYNGNMAFFLKNGAVACPHVGTKLDPKIRRRRPSSITLKLVDAATSPSLILTANDTSILGIDRKNPLNDNQDYFKAYKDRAFFFAGSPKQRLSKKLHGVNILWEVQVDCSGALIVAGNHAYAGGNGKVSAIDLNKKKVTWSANVDGKAYGLAAAGKQLFVSTDKGMIYCFGSGTGATINEVNLSPKIDPSAVKLAGEILKKSGIEDGYCVVLNCGSGDLVYELAKQSKLQVIGFDVNEKDISTGRKKLGKTGIYGTRVNLVQLDPKNPGLPPYFANLVILKNGSLPVTLARKIQRPHGGVLCSSKSGSITTDVRGPLKGEGTWTHQNGNPANTGSTTDTLAKGPLAPLWFDSQGPTNAGSKNRPPSPLYKNGRIYINGRQFIRCLDAYNGHQFWQINVPAARSWGAYLGSNLTGTNFVVTDKYLYVVDQRKAQCTQLDAMTGKTLKSFNAKVGTKGEWGYLAIENGLIYGTIEGAPFAVSFTQNPPALGRKHKLIKKYQEGVYFFALDPSSGQVKWSYQAKDNIPINGIAIGAGKVYLIDRPNMAKKFTIAREKKAQGPPSTAGGSLICLDAKTGKEIWRNSKDIFGTLIALSVEYKVIVMGSMVNHRGNLIQDAFPTLGAFSAKDGKKLWWEKLQYIMRPLIVGEKVIIDPGRFDWKRGGIDSGLKNVPCAFNIVTGKPILQENPVSGEKDLLTLGRTQKCSGWTASPNLLLFRTGTISYFDFTRNEGVSTIGGMRQGCNINVYPAGGLVLHPDNNSGCSCSYVIRTSVALRQMDQKEYWGTFTGQDPKPGIIKHAYLNVGAPGDRRDKKGNLWLCLPRPHRARKIDIRTMMFGRKAIDVKYEGIKKQNPTSVTLSWPYPHSETYRPPTLYRFNTETAPVFKTNTPWIYTNGNKGGMKVILNVGKMPADEKYKIKLHFAEPENIKPGERVFDVVLNNKTVLPGFDIIKESGKFLQPVIKEFSTSALSGKLIIETKSKKKEPILCGIEVLAIQ